MEDLQFFLAGVAGNMQAFALFINNFRTLAIQLVNDPGHRLLIAGNGRGGDNDPVTTHNIDLLVGRESHTVQGRHILTLGTGGHNNDLILRQALDGI